MQKKNEICRLEKGFADKRKNRGAIKLMALHSTKNTIQLSRVPRSGSILFKGHP
jgi:hypothetical protein